jgi:hypothetical protein
MNLTGRLKSRDYIWEKEDACLHRPDLFFSQSRFEFAIFQRRELYEN